MRSISNGYVAPNATPNHLNFCTFVAFRIFIMGERIESSKLIHRLIVASPSLYG